MAQLPVCWKGMLHVQSKAPAGGALEVLVDVHLVMRETVFRITVATTACMPSSAAILFCACGMRVGSAGTALADTAKDVQVDASWFHGSDGFGGAQTAKPEPLTADQLPQQQVCAVQALLSAAETHAGRLKVVALGPLTNIALAFKLRRSIAHSLAGLYVMGGAWGEGNVTPCAEFNFHVDPEAASIVMERFERVHLVTWTLTQGQPVPWEGMEAYLNGDTVAGRLMAAIMQRDLAKWKTDAVLRGGWIACDPMAMAVALDDGVVVESEQKCCHVEWEGSEVAKGMSVFSEGGDGKAPNVTLVRRIDINRFTDMMVASVLSAVADEHV